MNKTVIIFAFLLVGFTSKSQIEFSCADSIFDSQSENWEFSDILYTDTSITRDILFLKVREWFSENFASARNVLDNADKETGVLYGHGSISMSDENNGFVEFTIEIRCKNGKLKYSLTNFNHKQAYLLNVYGTRGPSPISVDVGSLKEGKLPRSGMGFHKKRWIKIKYESKIQTCNLINSLKSSISKESIGSKDNW